MGQYKVYYFEDLENAKVRIKCPVCENIGRNVIDPVAVILTKEDFNRFKDELNSINNLDELKNSEVFNHILNQDDLVCIFHQKKEGKHWEKDTKEFEEWNNKISSLYILKPTYKLFKILRKDNLVNQFWKRIRAYRFAIDYLDLWEEKQNWGNLIKSIKKKNIRIDLDELKKNKELIEFYFLNLRSNSVYDFKYFHFVSFFHFNNVFFISTFIEIKDENFQNFTFNFGYKGETLSFKKKIYFNNVIFSQNTNFNYIKFEDKLIFYNSVFIGNIEFNNVIFCEEVQFSKNIFKNNLQFNTLIFYKNINFYDIKVENNTEFKNVSFKKNHFITPLKISNFIIFESKLNNIIIENFDILVMSLIDIKTFDESYIKIKNINTSQLNLTNIFTDNFIFSNINLKEYNEKLRNVLKIDTFILSNPKFINCDFSQAKIEIKDSHLEETTFSNINWGKISEERICPDLFEKEPDKARDIYRQLKLSLEKQADYINANWFYALEMKAYEKYLQSQSWKEHFQDKLVFTFHKFISNFGQSWVRPFILIILSTFLLLGFAYQTNIEIIFPIPDKLKNLLTIKQSIFMPIYEILSGKPEYLLTLYNLAGIILIFQLIKDKEINKKKILYIFEKSILALTLAFILTIPIVIIFKLTTKLTLLDAIANLLDNFATTLNILNIFQLFSKDEQGNLTNTPHFYDGYYFIYKIYAIFILILIYQLIVAIRRRVRR